MTAPHDRPTASELLQAVKEWMEQDQITLGAPMEVRHEEVLQGLGVASDAELSHKIRMGEWDTDFPQLLEALRPVVEDKVRVANPKYLR
jgi:hypothetical protein